MNFDQGEFDLSGGGSEEGHRKWLLELEEKKRAFEVRHGVIVGRRVRVQMIDELKPMDGVIHLVSQKPGLPSAKLRLVIGKREFGTCEIENIVPLEDESEASPL